MINEKCRFGDDEISSSELKTLENVLDKLFASLDIDIKFTKHFLDRVNDTRNKRQITLCELTTIFKSLYRKYGVEISKEDGEIEEVIKSLSTNIHIPVNIRWDFRAKEIILVTKTVMRKKEFKYREKTLRVESFRNYLISEEKKLSHKEEVFLSRFKNDKVVDVVWYKGTGMVRGGGASAGKADYMAAQSLSKRGIVKILSSEGTGTHSTIKVELVDKNYNIKIKLSAFQKKVLNGVPRVDAVYKKNRKGDFIHDRPRWVTTKQAQEWKNLKALGLMDYNDQSWTGDIFVKLTDEGKKYTTLI